MKLTRDSWIVKWSYLPELDKIPQKTNICDLFWRAFFLMPLFCLFCGVLGPILAIGLALETIGNNFKHKAIEIAPSLIKQRLKDWKEKTCTLVEIE